MANGSWANRPAYPPNRIFGGVYVSRMARAAIGVQERAVTARRSPHSVDAKPVDRSTSERTFTTDSYGTAKTGKIQSMGRHRKRAGEVSWSAHIMNALRKILRSMVPSGIHNHQDSAQREISRATIVVEKQKQETDLLAVEVWRSMGGHP